MEKLLEALTQKTIGPLPYWGILLLFVIVGLPLLVRIYRENLPGVIVFLNRLLRSRLPETKPVKGVFIGPRPYKENESARFHGRETDIQECLTGLTDHGFFIIEGESGCGKSSLIRAGLLAKLSETYKVQILRLTYGEIKRVWPQHDDEQNTKPLLEIYDQFEELFVTVKDTEREVFMQGMRSRIERGEARICLSLRQDYFDLLRRLCEKVDTDGMQLSVRHYHTVKPFTQKQASDVLKAMSKPEDGSTLSIRMEKFCDRLAHDLLRPPRDSRLNREDQPTVLPVELQTIGYILQTVGSLSVDEFELMGGKSGLFRRFVDEATKYVWRVTGVNPEQSLVILEQLQSDAGTNEAKTVAMIHQRRPDFSLETISKVLNAFSDKYIVHQPPREGLPDGDLPYEYLHEHLIGVLKDAPSPAQIRVNEAKARLRFWIERAESEIRSATEQRRPLRKIFYAPIGMMEAAYLWRFADSQQRKVLWQNQRGWATRYLALALIVGIPLIGWEAWTRTWAYQMQQIISNSSQAVHANNETVIAFLRALTWQNANHALIMCEKIKEDDFRSRALSAIATEQAKIGKPEQVAKLFEQAVETAAKIKDDSSRSRALAAIATEQAKLKQFEQAVETATKIKDDSSRSRALVAIASEMAKLKQFEQAVEAAGKIRDDYFQARALATIGSEMVKAGKTEEAFRQFKRALETAGMIHTASSRAFALAAIGSEMRKLGHTEEAEKQFERAVKLSEDLGNIRSGSSRVRVLAAIASEMARLGKTKEADKQYERAVEMAGTSSGRSLSGNDALDVVTSEMANVGDLFGELGRFAKIAEKIMADAMTAIKKERWKAFLSKIQSKMGDERKAQETATGIGDISVRLEAYTFLMQEHLKRNNPDYRRIWDKEMQDKAAEPLFRFIS